MSYMHSRDTNSAATCHLAAPRAPRARTECWPPAVWRPCTGPRSLPRGVGGRTGRQGRASEPADGAAGITEHAQHISAGWFSPLRASTHWSSRQVCPRLPPGLRTGAHHQHVRRLRGQAGPHQWRQRRTPTGARQPRPTCSKYGPADGPRWCAKHQGTKIPHRCPANRGCFTQ